MINCKTLFIILSWFLIITLISCAFKRKKVDYIEIESRASSSSEIDFRTTSNKLVIDDIEYDLNNSIVSLPDTIEIKNGGSIKNGILSGNSTFILNNDQQYCFKNIEISGTWANDYVYLSWFAENTTSLLNFKGLCNALNTTSKVLVDDLYSLETTSISRSYTLQSDIHIVGLNGKSGFVLETKHDFDNAYFSSDSGNNIILSKIHLKAAKYNYSNFSTSQDYTFARCDYSSRKVYRKPELSLFSLDSCLIDGPIAFKYGADFVSNTFTGSEYYGIDTIQITNCIISNSNTLFELSNGIYIRAIIDNNTIKNIYGPTFFFPLGGLSDRVFEDSLYKNRTHLSFSNNIIENEKPIYSFNNSYLSPIIAKGNNFIVSNNKISNIINLRNGVETVSFYCSSRDSLIIKDNIIKNCLSRGINIPGGSANCLLKLKGARNVYAVNNTFSIDSISISKFLDILQNDNFNVSKFRLCLIGAELNKNNFVSSYYFNNNTFNSYLLTDLSNISRSKFTFTNNKLHINYFLNPDATNWGDNGVVHENTLFLLRDSVKHGSLLVLKNTIQIDSIKSSLYFTRDYNDNKNFDFIKYDSNVYLLNGNVFIAFPRSKYLYVNDFHNGKGCISFNEMSTDNSRTTLPNINSNSKIRHLLPGNYSIGHLKSFGNYRLTIDSVFSNSLSLLDIRQNDLLFNDSILLRPILCNVNANFTFKDGSRLLEEYYFIIRNFNSVLFINNFQNLVDSRVFSSENNINYSLLPTSKKNSNYPLKLVSDNGYSVKSVISLNNLSSVKSLEARITLSKIETSANVTVNFSDLLLAKYP